MDVRAAFAVGQHRPVAVDTFSLDGPREDEVLIQIRAAGLCHTDLMLLDGSRDWSDYPIILGHEGAGIVCDCGPEVTSVRPGDHVIPVSMPECGVCVACRNPKTNLCDEFYRPSPRRAFLLNGRPTATFRDVGTFSEFVMTREMQVTKIRKDAPLDVASCMGCAGATGIGAVMFTARMEPGATVAVFGLGGIGLNVVAGAKLCGASTIIGVDTNPAKETSARSAGVKHFLNPKKHGRNIPDMIKELTQGGVDYSFECVGHENVLRQAVESTRAGWGVTVMIGLFPGTQELTLRPRSILEGRKLMGSILGNTKMRSALPDIVDWYVEGRFGISDLISHRIKLDEINSGFELLKSGEARRVVIDF
jgi:S-(hydroxymethyl)glutathione dehydrogenase / alcohol dehydrogenase